MPLSKGKKIGIGVGIAAAVIAVVAVIFFQQAQRVPSDGAVRAQVEKLIGSPQHTLTKVHSTVTPTSPGEATVAYEAQAEVREPLYEPADATAFMHDELKLDVPAWQRARKTLSGKTAPRILELGGLKGIDETLLRTTFLRESTPKGAPLTFSGSLHATKGTQGWQFTGENPSRTAGEERGQPRATFEGSTTVVTDPGELQKLHTLAAAQADLPAKVELGRQAFLEERRAEQEKIVAQLVEAIQAGTVYGGTATLGTDAPAKVFLEFASVDPASKQVTATFRNDGSWTDKRPLKGSFTFDPDSETLALTLATSAYQAVRKAGPVVGDEATWQLVFQLSAGRLTARDEHRDFNLTRLSESAADAARKEIEAAAAVLHDAASAGKIYRGTLRSRTGDQTFDTMLRFSRENNESGAVTASLEPAGRETWRRTYRGTLVANRYRAQGTPLHLESRASEAVSAADKQSPVGLKRVSALSFQFVDGHFRGESDDFSYDFSPLSAADVAKLEAAAAEREKSQLAVVKAATAYPGAAQLDGKSTTEQVRLRFRRVGPHGAEIDAVVESVDRPGVSREYRGSLDTAEHRLVLTSTNRGRVYAGNRAGSKFPAFAHTGESVISLDIASDTISGEVRGQGWKLSFPVASAVAVTADSPNDYPAQNGAYVWTTGGWVPLPRNDSKVSKSALQVIGGLFSTLSKSISSSAAGEKIAELGFSGHDPVPAVNGEGVVIIYVGPVNNALQEKYPQLRDYPEMEMAPTAADNDGTRKAALYRVVANTSAGGFREHRVMGALDRVSDNVLELSCTRTLPAGSYAISVNEDAFELKVE